MMKTVTMEYNIYRFGELSDQAKEAVKARYLEERDPSQFSDMCEEDLRFNLFPHSELKVQFSLNYCQGDGLNICGGLSYDDFLPALKENLSDAAKALLERYCAEYGGAYIMTENYPYHYCIADTLTYTENIWEDFEDSGVENLDHLCDEIDTAMREYMNELCRGYEKWGYEFFYEVEDDEVEEWADSMDMWFTEDGQLFM